MQRSPSTHAIDQNINLGSCSLSARDYRLCRTMFVLLRPPLSIRARNKPDRSCAAQAIASKVLHVVPPANDSIAVRETLILRGVHLFCGAILPGSYGPEVLRGALISVATPR
jgi:hypothetical protein